MPVGTERNLPQQAPEERLPVREQFRHIGRYPPRVGHSEEDTARHYDECLASCNWARGDCA